MPNLETPEELAGYIGKLLTGEEFLREWHLDNPEHFEEWCRYIAIRIRKSVRAESLIKAMDEADRLEDKHQEERKS